MAVMAAHMGVRAVCAEREPVVFFDRKCIHIRPQQNTGISVSDCCVYAGCPFHAWKSGCHIIFCHFFRKLAAASFPADSHIIQTLSDVSTCPWKFGSYFRTPVQVTPILPEL